MQQLVLRNYWNRDPLDAIKDSADRKLKDSKFYKCYLTKPNRLDNDNFIVQISYMALMNNPVFTRNYRLLAKK